MPYYKGYIPLKRKTPPPSNIQEKKIQEPSLLSTMANGMAFGTGSSIAHKTIDTITNKPPVDKSHCIYLQKLYEECMKNQSTCEDYVNILKEMNCPST
tara:strand:+ start:1006 stop:1299 length:294 start_codon:yes stop_codon:yes gene_type:complete